MTYLFEVFKQVTERPVTLHGISHDGLSQGFGATWFAHQEERYAQLYAHHHHENILLEGAVSRDVGTELDSGKEHVLASGYKESKNIMNQNQDPIFCIDLKSYI